MKRESVMTPCERVVASLKREPVDVVPWIEGIVNNGIASAVCGEPINVDWSVAPDGFPTMPGAALAEEQKKVNRVLGKANIQFSAFAPIFCHKMEQADDGSPVLVGDGKILRRRDFETVFKLPSPTDSTYVENAREFIAHKGDYCACACVRLGIGATLLSMGLEAFAYALADEPELITDVHDAYADWTALVVPVLEEIGFDVIWAFDDVAFNSGPVFNPDFYKERILPKELETRRAFTRPFITHSDGDMNPLMDVWLGLEQDAIHPLQTNVMDIYDISERYGDRIALVGNIFMDDLVDKEPDDIRNEVRTRMERLGRRGGYVISSSNSLTDNMKPGNVLAMSEAIRQFGVNN